MVSGNRRSPGYYRPEASRQASLVIFWNVPKPRTNNPSDRVEQTNLLEGRELKYAEYLDSLGSLYYSKTRIPRFKKRPA